MYNGDWFDDKISELIEKAGNGDFSTNITETNVLQAKELIKTNAYSTAQFFLILASINLLNASIKRPEYKNRLSYSEIKGNVSRILHYLITIDFKKYNLDFYINPTEQCAYVEIYNLQFSFHNININDTIKGFIDSDRNKIKAWKEIRLQRIAGELFDLSIINKEMNKK